MWKLRVVIATSVADVAIPLILTSLAVADALSGDSEYPPLKSLLPQFIIVGLLTFLITVLTLLVVKRKTWARYALAMVNIGLAIFIGVTLWQLYRPMFDSPNMFTPRRIFLWEDALVLAAWLLNLCSGLVLLVPEGPTASPPAHPSPTSRGVFALNSDVGI